MIEISVVIPTRNRKARLLSLLENLNLSTYPIHEVIIIDSSDLPEYSQDYSAFDKLRIIYQTSEPSVCVQRNIGIRLATADWVFLCDDDIEVPLDYLEKIARHIDAHPESGAVSGIVMQQENGEWATQYSISSTKELLLKYLFRLSVWGEIKCPPSNLVARRLIQYYQKRGNHISCAGWPVITQLGNEYSTVPVYGLGASLVRRQWLIESPYDEVLDAHGIGDNYGVAISLPAGSIHLVNEAFVYHHHDTNNRLQRPLQYYRRALALDYFIKRDLVPDHVERGWLLLSLLGNALLFSLHRDRLMVRPSWKTFWNILTRANAYYEAYHKGQKVVEPKL